MQKITSFFSNAGRAEQALKLFGAVVVGSLLLAVSARVQVPFWPVPMTMQTLVVVVIAMTLGSRTGALVMGAYVLEGLLGLPVFANAPERGIGLAYILGPTGGYLVGFIVAGYVCGWLAERGFRNSMALALAANTIGTAIIIALGFAWLSTLIGPEKAFAAGVVPFLFGSVVKIILGAVIVRTLASRSA